MINEISQICENKTVCVVGPAVLDKNMSDFIDSHDIVVRINQCHKLKNNWYGKKNDICFFNVLKKFEFNENNKFENIVHLNFPYYNKDEYKHFKNKIYLKKKKINYLYVTQDDIPILRNQYGIKCHTTGGITLHIFLHIIKSIKSLSIVGMSLGLTRYNELYHDKNYSSYNSIYKSDLESVSDKIINLDQKNKDKIYIQIKDFSEYIEKKKNKQM